VDNKTARFCKAIHRMGTVLSAKGAIAGRHYSILKKRLQSHQKIKIASDIARLYYHIRILLLYEISD